MFCKRFSCTLSTEICLKRQERAKNQSDSEKSFCESLIFCCKCPDGEKIRQTNKKCNLDVLVLKRDTVKVYLARKDYRMFKLKRIKLKRFGKIVRIQLKGRNGNGVFKK